MKRRGSRAAIISVLLLGLLIFGVVYFAWTTITDVFQPVSASQTTIPFVVKSGETGSQVADAFRIMSQGKHSGKMVVDLQDPGMEIVSRSVPRVAKADVRAR